MSLQLHRPDGRGGIEPRLVQDRNWRNQLRSPRWGMARPKHELPRLANVDMNPTRTWLAVAFWLGLATLTFVILVLGYGTGFWN